MNLAGHLTAAGGLSDVEAAWVTAAASLALAVGGLLVFAGRWIWRIQRRMHQFFDDWAGEPGRPGVPERPGVMTRLQTAEASDRAFQATLAKVLAETSPNGGASMRDAINKTQADVGELRRELEAHTLQHHGKAD